MCFQSQKQREASSCGRVVLVSSMAFFNHCPPGPGHKNESDDDNGDDDDDGDEDNDDVHLVDEDCSSSLAR